MAGPMKEPPASTGGFSHVHPAQLTGSFPTSGPDTMFSNAFTSPPGLPHASMPSTSAYTLNASDLNGGSSRAEPQRRSPSSTRARKQHSPSHQDLQQGQDDETITPAEARRLKRKEQNRMAQRRHREKQRSQIRRQRKGSNGEGSPPDSDSGDQKGPASTAEQSAQHHEPAFSHVNPLPDGLPNSFLSQGDRFTGHLAGGPSGQSTEHQPSPHQQHQYLSYHSGQGQQYADHTHERMPRAKSERDDDISPIQVPSDQFDYSQLLVNDGGRRIDGQGQLASSSSSQARNITNMHGLPPPLSQQHQQHGSSTIRPSDLHSGEMAGFFGSEDDAEPNSAASHDSGFGFQHLQSGVQGSTGSDPPGFHSHQAHAEAQAADVRAAASRLDLSDNPGEAKAQGYASSDSQGGKKRRHKGPGLALGDNSSNACLPTTVSRPMSNAELLKYFASLTSLQMPWADQLLSPRWDLIKVLELASARLGLMFQYVEDDRSISFLANDFVLATRGLGHGPATSGPGQTELGQWPTEDDPDVRVPVGQSLSAAAAMASAAAMGSASNVGKGEHAKEGGGGNGSSAGPVLRWSHVPHNMRPSRLSGFVGHHPYIDLSFPWPMFRDRVLAAMSCHLLHEVDLCMEIWPGEDLQPVGAEPPYWIHGDDPFDPESYEVSDRFAKRYPWLLDAEIIRRTNWWRRQQSKPELPLMVTQVSRSFAPFFSQQIEHLTNPERVPPPGQLPQALNHLGIGSMIPPLGQLFGVNAPATFLQPQQGGGGETGGGASITAMDEVMSSVGAGGSGASDDG